jgi:hypothetical protein
MIAAGKPNAESEQAIGRTVSINIFIGFAFHVEHIG